MDEDLLRTFKALADASRLRIVGLLAARRMAVEELAAALELTPATVVHHLKRLREARLVEAHPRHPYVEYSLRLGRLQEIGRTLGEASRTDDPGALAAGPDGRPRPAFDAKVLRSFFDGDRLVSIPVQEKKRHVVLRYLAQTVFDEARPYPEKEVNQRLALLHPDVASLRRYLVDLGYMRRQSAIYELRPEADWPS